MYRAEPMEKKGAHNSHATASEKGANHGFLGSDSQSAIFQNAAVMSSVSRFYNDLTEARGLPKFAEVV